MNSDDDELKSKVLTGEVSINAGYKSVREKEVCCANAYNKEGTLVLPNYL